MEVDRKIGERDLHTLIGIVRGPGYYATPSPERINRLMDRGLVMKKRHGMLRPTLKGKIVAWLNKHA